MNTEVDTLRQEYLSAHHEVGECAAVLKDWERARDAGTVDAIQEVLRKRVRDHFLWEEQVLFPLVLKRDPSLRDAVTTLRVQHLEMLRDIAELFQATSGLLLERSKAEAQADLMAGAKPIIDRLVAHARLEDELLLPGLGA